MIDKFDNDQIACMPLDTGIFEFDKNLFEELLEHDTLLQTGDARSSYVWGRKEVVLQTRGSEKEHFFNVVNLTDNWYNRYELYNVEEYNINPMFSSNLRNQTKNLLNFINDNIPIFPAHITLVRSTGDVPPHCDCPPEQVKYFYNKGLEPANVKILLNPEDYDDTLYFCRYGTKGDMVERKFFEKNKHMPADTNVYGWSENFHAHGATYKENTCRMLVNVFGPVNKEKYKKLIHRSFKKYKNYAITFEMDTNASFN